MISADAAFVFYEGSKVSHATNIQVIFKYNPIQSTALCELIAYAGGSEVEQVGSYGLIITKAEISAKTGTGTDPIDKVLNQVEQVVIDYLDGITENSAVGFTN